MSTQRERRFKNKTFNDPFIYENNAQLIKTKLRLGANPNYIRKNANKYKDPAINYAILKKYSELIEIVKAFINDTRTDINAINKYNNTPLIYACYPYVSDEIGSEVVSLLLKHSQIQTNLQSQWGYTAINYACLNGRINCVKVLIDDDRVDVNIPNIFSKTPLYYAVQQGHLEIVKLLLSSASLDPNILSKGETPLHLAHRQDKKLFVIELLKDRRTDPTIEDKNGKMVITQIKDKEIVKHIQPF